MASTHEIAVYSSESIVPIKIYNYIHLESINDLVWDGTTRLIAASSDGFISFMNFEDPNNEIGELLPLENIPAAFR